MSAKGRKAERVQWKNTRKEAKKQYKMQMKAVKQAFKQERRALKQEKKAWKQSQRASREHSHQDRHRQSWCEVQPSSAGDLSLPGSGHAPAAEQEVPSAQQELQQSPLERLAEMGFENIELNAQLLEARGGNLEQVVQELMRLTAEEDADMLK